MFDRYKLAEKLSERLDEMGKDLTSMIEEVNGASATLSKTNRADEPVSELTSHVIHSTFILTFPTDLPDRPYPQLAPVPTASHRPGHI
jgi:nuclear pore complex protein Nup62